MDAEQADARRGGGAHGAAWRTTSDEL